MLQLMQVHKHKSLVINHNIETLYVYIHACNNNNDIQMIILNVCIYACVTVIYT